MFRCIVTLACWFAVICTAHCHGQLKPNIVVIYADDLGYGDVGCYNPDRGKIPTPNIDALAKQGIRFTDAHSSSAVCSPSRYTLLTGRYHWRTRLQRGIVGLWETPLIAPSRMTIGTLAKQAGYRTACFGKWHLGWNWGITEDQKEWLRPPGKKKQAVATARHRKIWRDMFTKSIDDGPTAVGFDTYFGTDVPNWPPFCFIRQDQTVGIPSEFLPEELLIKNRASQQGPALQGWELEPVLPAIAQATVQFIRTHGDQSQPFLIYLPLTSPHTPLAVNQRWKGKSGLNLYADFVMETDAVVGQVINAVDEIGSAANTVVIFTSDNGCAHYIGAGELESMGHYPSGPLRGYKSDVWEGGHRVPYIVRWPKVVAPNQVSHQLVHQADLLATIADLVGTDLPPDAGEDSFSMLPLLSGHDAPVRREAVCCSIRGMPSIRDGNWKLILGAGSGGWSKGGEDASVQLYDLKHDIGETKNLATTEHGRVANMTKRFEELIANGRSTIGPIQSNDIEVIRHPR